MKGFSNRAIDLIIKSWRRSTVDQYVTYIKLWYNFSRQGLTLSIRNIIEFLVHLHTQGYTHDQVCAARSAVGTISNFELLGKHPDVKRVMKGMFESNPQLPKYSSVWDVRVLLNYFRTIPHQKELSLKLLSKKLAAMLGILAGGQRCQTIHAITVTDMKVTTDKLIIPIYDPIKQTKKGKHMKPLEFKMYPNEEKLCVVDNLITYLAKTNQYRSDSKLFISYQKPHHAVSKDTVTRWIKDVMKNAGIDITKHVTHSCRAAASSFAYTRNIPIKKIVDGETY